jgi:amino acid transporter
MLANVAYLAVLPVRGSAQVEALDIRIAQHTKLGQKAEAEALAKEKKDLLEKSSPFDRGIANAKDDRVATAVLEQWSPKLGAPLMAAAIMVSAFGCINGMILMGARLYYAMAVDNLFFKKIGTLNAHSVPAVGLIAQGFWSILLVFSGTYNELLDFVIFAVLVFYVLTVSGLFILRRTQPDAERPYKAWGYPVLPALYVFLCAVIMLDLLVVKPKYTWPGLIIVLTGIPVYFLWRTLGRGPSPALTAVLESELKGAPVDAPEEHIQAPNDQIQGPP